jgi:simple sugar transport system ATP-binding protein
VLILDEPTAVLTPQESRDLFATLRELVREGLSIIFISHKLDEVLAVSDRIAVLRNGRLVATRPAQGRPRRARELMVGRAVTMPTRERRAAGAGLWPTFAALAFREAAGIALLDGVDLTVAAGEIVAIAGCRGQRASRRSPAAVGTLAADEGTITLAGRAMAAEASRLHRRRRARIPEDRHAVGVIGDLAVWRELVSERLRTAEFARAGIRSSRGGAGHARDLVQRFDVRGSGSTSHAFAPAEHARR